MTPGYVSQPATRLANGGMLLQKGLAPLTQLDRISGAWVILEIQDSFTVKKSKPGLASQEFITRLPDDFSPRPKDMPKKHPTLPVSASTASTDEAREAQNHQILKRSYLLKTTMFSYVEFPGVVEYWSVNNHDSCLYLFFLAASQLCTLQMFTNLTISCGLGQCFCFGGCMLVQIQPVLTYGIHTITKIIIQETNLEIQFGPYFSTEPHFVLLLVFNYTTYLPLTSWYQVRNQCINHNSTQIEVHCKFPTEHWHTDNPLHRGWKVILKVFDSTIYWDQWDFTGGVSNLSVSKIQLSKSFIRRPSLKGCLLMTYGHCRMVLLKVKRKKLPT